jgi:hypothetical protein
LLLDQGINRARAARHLRVQPADNQYNKGRASMQFR